MEFTAEQIFGLLANKETAIVGFCLIFIAWALLERKDRKAAEAKILDTMKENLDAHNMLLGVVNKFDDNTAFWRDTIIRLTEKSLSK